ncbi:MAG TPA: aldehyde dehydrogenase family protein [Thermoanaerobaculia bacterium]
MSAVREIEPAEREGRPPLADGPPRTGGWEGLRRGDDAGARDAARRTVARVRAAQEAWGRRPLAERLQVVRRFRRRLAARGAALAGLVAGSGAEAARARGEVLVGQVIPLADACRFLEDEAAALLAPERPAGRRPPWLGGGDLVVERRPLGVVLVVAPANYPVLLPGVQCLQALVAGNAVLLKPGAGGRAAALWLAARLLEAGLPRDVLEVLGEEPEAAAAALAGGVDHLVLTGSAATGAMLARRAAERLVPSTLELSGCDPLIALPGSDPRVVAAALAFALRWNGGATCIAPRRAYLPAEMAPAVARALVAELMGEVGIGADAASLAAARRAAAAAVAAGARLVFGDLDPGAPPGPVVLADPPDGARALAFDGLAPLVSLVAVRSVDEAVRRASQGPFALGAAVFGPRAAARAVAARLPARAVTINDLVVPTADPRLPFGGRRASGWGTTRGAEGLRAMTVPVAVTSRRRPHRRRAWSPLHGADERLFAAWLALDHGSPRQRVAGAGALVGALAARRRQDPLEERR